MSVVDSKVVDSVKSSAKARGKRLRSLRKMADLTRKDIQELYKINAGTLQGWEDARFGGLTLKGASRVIKALRSEGLQCHIDWLMYGVGTPPLPSDRLYMEAGDELSHDFDKDKADEDAIVEELMCFRRCNPEAIDLLITDDGMEPQFKEGDCVAGKKRTGEQIKELVGMNCIVETAQGEVLLRNLRSGKEPGMYTLTCVNPHTGVSEPIIYNISLAHAAPVIWHRRKDII